MGRSEVCPVSSVRRSARLALALALVLTVIPFAIPAVGGGVSAETYWVDDDGSDSDPGTESQPFKTITHALSVSDFMDTIMVKPGTYDAANGESFPLAVFGETLMSTGGADVTLLDAGSSGRVMAAQNFSEADVISGFTFTGGLAQTGSALNVFLDWPTGPSSPLIERNVFESNESTIGGGGGAVLLFSSGPGDFQPVIRDNGFYDNVAAGQGGALRISGHVPARIEDNEFGGNWAQSGGAISAASLDSTLTITGNDFFANEATDSRGGAIYFSHTGGQTHQISDNGFYGNIADNDGGALWLYGADFSVERNEAFGNTAFDDGGFAYAQNSSVESENNLVAESSAGASGTAWFAESSVVELRSDTVVGSAVVEGSGGNGAAVEVADPFDMLIVLNSILWNPDSWADVVGADTLTYTCLSDADADAPGKGNTVGSGVIFSDPSFIDDLAGDYRLAPGSPCIDTAWDEAAPSDDFFGTPRPQDGDGNGSAYPDMGYFERPTPVVGRLAGSDRYATAVAVAKANFDAADTCILASGMDFPDALSAAGLAGSYGAPLLLTRPDSVPSSVADALSDLGVEDVIIIGGTKAVSPGVETSLGSSYAVTRIAGANRYDTSAKVAREIASLEGDDFSETAFIARGDAFPDALAVSPFAYSGISPILLTRPDALPTESAKALDDLNVGFGYVCGGTSAVSSGVKSAVDGILVANGGFPTDRWAGADRYETASVVAEGGWDDGFGSFDYVGVATGTDYPDALAGGVAAGANGGVVLLTNPTSLPSPTKQTLASHKAEVLYVDVFGGQVAVSDGVIASIESALGW